ncbi:hypothetical protein LK994_04040 [Ferruginibacter lapsinanis]|uniref:hypothetical protein n=1 Tax=Ferruginibacter lapsinanis TaxID=563172 RepID=UPI001E2A10E6|nr:hypothetical protein [Ferruginibacter lapsinanis]UEG50641.1 hypothetical protein LK994_04040 [Ferruginibacter lapsinanis]
MSEMEPDVRAFLLRIVQTISMAMLWLLVNMTIGIYFDLAFFEGSPTIWNYIFYVWFLVTFALLLMYFRNKWKQTLNKKQ